MKDGFALVLFGVIGIGLLYLVMRNRGEPVSSEPVSLKLRPA